MRVQVAVCARWCWVVAGGACEDGAGAWWWDGKQMGPIAEGGRGQEGETRGGVSPAGSWMSAKALCLWPLVC